MNAGVDTGVEVRAAAFAELSPAVLYGILRLRSEVFVVEQHCLFVDPDGRDAEPGARHLWAEAHGGRVVGCGRVLEEADGWSIGRIVTDRQRRRTGVGAAIVSFAVGLTRGRSGGPVAINAQSPLAGWYAGFGFVVCGREFVEDGIPHVPMRLEGG